MSNGFRYLLCFISIIDSTNSQYMPGKKSNKVCEGADKTSLVEHFFDVIFNEFHSSPPLCICVQMCEDQPTYCYPNGCLKRTDNKKKSSEDLRPPVTHIQYDGSSKTILVDDRNAFTLVLNHPDGKKNAPKQTEATREYLSDIYKSIFKYKKLPRMELKYNLREQVKNMKSNVFKLETDDVSKTRWPKIHHKIFHDQKVFTNVKSLDLGNASSFLSTPKHNSQSYTTRYFKRDLRNSKPFENSDNVVDIEDKSDVSDKSFSIKTLIDNLVGNSFNRANSSNIHLEVNYAGKSSDLRNVKKITNNSSNETIYDKEMRRIDSMNLTNEIKEESEDMDDKIISDVVKKWSNYNFNEMIVALSKQIDLQNNTSMEMMKRNTVPRVMKEKSYQNITNTSLPELDNTNVKLIIKYSNDTAFNDNRNNSVILENTTGTVVKVN